MGAAVRASNQMSRPQMTSWMSPQPGPYGYGPRGIPPFAPQSWMSQNFPPTPPVNPPATLPYSRSPLAPPSPCQNTQPGTPSISPSQHRSMASSPLNTSQPSSTNEASNGSSLMLPHSLSHYTTSLVPPPRPFIADETLWFSYFSRPGSHPREAMDPANGPEIHHHLARAIMHLNSLAGFLPFFEPAIDWDDPAMVPPRAYEPMPNTTRYGRPPLTRRHPHLRTPYPTLATHGDLPQHMITNPVPQLRPIAATPVHSHHEPTDVIPSTPSFLPIHRSSTTNEEHPINHIASSSDPTGDRPTKRPRTDATPATGLVILPPQPKPPCATPRPVDATMSTSHATPPGNSTDVPSSHPPAESAATDSSDHNGAPYPILSHSGLESARALSIVLARSRQRRLERGAIANYASTKRPDVRPPSPPTTPPNPGPATTTPPKARPPAPLDVPGVGMPNPFKPWTHTRQTVKHDRRGRRSAPASIVIRRCAGCDGSRSNPPFKHLVLSRRQKTQSDLSAHGPTKISPIAANTRQHDC